MDVDDDVFDTAAASWTAARFTGGRRRPIRKIPEDFGDGHAAAIWA